MLTSNAQTIRTLAGAEWSTRQPLSDLLEKAERSLKNPDELTPWVHYLRNQAEARYRQLDGLTDLADGGAIAAAHLQPAFRFVFYSTLARALFTEYPELSAFSGVTHGNVRRQFADADRQAIALFRERVAAIIDCRPVPAGNRSGLVGSWTDLALIDKEINKQK